MAGETKGMQSRAIFTVGWHPREGRKGQMNAHPREVLGTFDDRDLATMVCQELNETLANFGAKWGEFRVGQGREVAL